MKVREISKVYNWSEINLLVTFECIGCGMHYKKPSTVVEACEILCAENESRAKANQY